MQTVAITGATGLLGSTLMIELTKCGLNPVALTSDIRDAEALRNEVLSIAPAWVVHTAAMTNVGEAEKNPDIARAVNAYGTSNVVEAARTSEARVIYISSASVFKGDRGNYVEDDAPEATNVYNQTKIEGEQFVLAYEKGMVLRLNLVGIHPKGSRGKNFLEWLVDSIRANKDLSLFNDQNINALSNWSVSQFIGKIITGHIEEQVLHIGTSDVVSKAGFAKKLLTKFPDYTGAVTETSVDTIGDGAFRPKEMWLNADKAQKLFGILPTAEQEIELIWNRK